MKFKRMMATLLTLAMISSLNVGTVFAEDELMIDGNIAITDDVDDVDVVDEDITTTEIDDVDNDMATTEIDDSEIITTNSTDDAIATYDVVDVIDTQAELQEAINEAQDGETIYIGGNIELTSSLTGISGRELTFDGSDLYTISFDNSTSVIGNAVFGTNKYPLYDDTILTVQNLTIQNTSATAGGYATVTGIGTDGIEITYDNCTFENFYTGVYVNWLTDADASLDLTIEDCTYINTTYGYSVDEVTNNAIVDAVNVTFKNNSGYASESETWKSIVLDNGDYKQAYGSLANAIAAADNGDSIILADGVVINSAVTIDKGISLIADGDVTVKGVKITVATDDVTIDGFTFENAGILGSNKVMSNLTIQNNTFTLDEDTKVNYAVQINNDYTFNASGDFIGNPISGLTIKDNTFTGYTGDGSVRASGVLIGSIEGTTTISGNTFTNMRNFYAFAVAGSPDGTLKITNNTFDGWDGRVTGTPVNTAIFLGQRVDSSYAQTTLADQTTANITVSNNQFIFNDDLVGVNAINGEGLFDEEAINHTYSLQNNYWGSENPDFATLCPEILNVDFDDVFYYTDEAMTKLVSNAGNTVVDAAEEALTNVDNWDVTENATEIAEAAEIIASLDKESLAKDADVIDSINTLDALFVDANANLSVSANLSENVEIEENDKINLESSYVSGLGLAVYGNGDSIADDTNLTLEVAQLTTDAADFAFTAVPKENGTLIANSNLQTPITFRIDLPTSFESSYVSVEHIKTGGGSETFNLKVLDDGTKYIVITVTGFSTFYATSYTPSSTSKSYYIKATAVGNGTVAPEGEDVSPDSMYKVSKMSDVTFEFDADSGYEVTDVIVNGKSVGACDEYEFEDIIITMQTLEVVFEKKSSSSSSSSSDDDDEDEDEEEVEAVELPFTDIDEENDNFKGIAYVYENGIMAGITSEVFGSELSITRGMIAAILFRINDSEVVEADMPFADITADQYYYEAIRWGKDAGVMAGISATEFAPNTAITIEQFIAFLYRYASVLDMDMNVDGDLSDYADASAISDYAYTAMLWAVENDIIGDDDFLNPKTEALRGVVATALMNFMELM